jgi:flagellar biosynthetic protein FliR
VIVELPAFDGMAAMTRLTIASVRPLAVVALLPGLAGASLPWRARLALVSALAVFSAFGPQALALSWNMLPGEVLAGLLAGLGLAMAFAAAGLAGEMLAQMIGLGFANLGPAGGNAGVMQGLFTLLMWAVLLAGGAHLALADAMLAGGTLAPPGAVTAGNAAALGLVMFATGLSIGLPLVALLLLGNALVALASRATPQLSAMAIAPALLLLGLVAALPLLLDSIWGRMAQALAAAMAPLA